VTCALYVTSNGRNDEIGRLDAGRRIEEDEAALRREFPELFPPGSDEEPDV
jgi:hypothetical protein